MIRSLLHTLKNYATSTILNLVGLSLAFAAFFVLMLQVDYERSFDRFHPKADRIYRVQFTDCATVPRALVETFGRSSSQIVRYSIANLDWQQTFTTERNGVRTRWEEPMIQVSEDFSAIFDLQMVEGPADALTDPNNVLLPQSMAQKLFPSDKAVGKQILLGDSKSPLALTVGGVYRDLPGNSQVKNTILRRMGDQIGRDTTDASGYRWGQWNYFMYVELAPGADVKALVDNYVAAMQEHFTPRIRDEKSIEMQLLSDIYFDARPMEVSYRVAHGDSATSNMLLLVALLVLVVAAVNFINFATAMAPMRIKAINIKKVFGASNSSLRLQLMAESLVLCLAAYLLSLLWLSLAAYTPVVEWSMSGSVDLASNPTVAWTTAIAALVLGLVAGIYPAFYTTRVPAVLALKGRYGSSRSGRVLRTGLVGVQFVVAIALIAGALMLGEQNRYMRNFDTGLDKEGILVVPLSGPMKGDLNKLNVLTEKVKQNPLVQEVAFAQFDMGASNNCQGWNLLFGETDVPVECYPVSWNYPEVMGLELVEGSYLTAPLPDQYNYWSCMINETAAKQGDYANAEQKITVMGDPAKIEGVLKNFHNKSLHYPIAPTILVLGLENWSNWAFVRYTGSPAAAMEHLKQVTKELDPEYMGDIRFLDAAFDNLYKTELRNAHMILSFSVLVVLVALMGVFGLVIFDSRYRRREIGLRRVYGSSTNAILSLFNLQFIKIVALCFVVAVPLAWWAAEAWLSGFVVRTPIRWWVFLLAGLVVLGITIATVTVQAWRTAHENPVDSIKTE